MATQEPAPPTNPASTMDIQFAIVIATYPRKNGKTLEYLQRCVDSVLSQTHTHWDIFLIGDKYDPESELQNFMSTLKMRPGNANKIYFLNNYVVERDVIRNDPHELWCCGGANSMNIGLALARNHKYMYYAHLDDDDYWEPDHLAEMATIYTKYPKCIFVCMQSTTPQDGLLPMTNDYGTTMIFENNMLPLPLRMVHSAFSFRLDIIPFYYKTNLNPIFNSLINEPKTQPADAMMLHHIRLFIEASQDKHTSIFVPKLTCHHDTECANYTP